MPTVRPYNCFADYHFLLKEVHTQYSAFEDNEQVFTSVKYSFPPEVNTVHFNSTLGINTTTKLKNTSYSVRGLGWIT